MPLRYPDDALLSTAFLHCETRKVKRALKMFEMFYGMHHTPFTRSIPSDQMHRTRQNPMEDRATLGSDLSAMWDFAESIAL